MTTKTDKSGQAQRSLRNEHPLYSQTCMKNCIYKKKEKNVKKINKYQTAMTDAKIMTR